MSGYNYVPNPAFQSSTTGWSGVNATLSLNNGPTLPDTGAFSLLVTATGSTPGASVSISGLVVGKRYNVSAYFYLTSAVTASITVNTVNSTSTNFTLLNTWGRVRNTFTATATTHAFTFSTNGSSGSTFYVDRVKVTDGELPGPYFDGSYPFTVWTGAANASVSYNSALDFNISSLGLDEPVLAEGFCLNTLAFNNTTKSGRWTLPNLRGSNDTITSRRGLLYAPNRPTDAPLWTLSMFVLGCLPDGSMPSSGPSQYILQNNLTQILQQVYRTTGSVTLTAWQSDGTCRQTEGVIDSSFDVASFMAGKRAELTLVFDVLPGTWSDVLINTTTGTPSAAWSNQALSLSKLVGGQATIEDAVITVTGPINFPKIMDTTSGVWVQYNGMVAAGNSWVVDSGNYTSSINGASVLSTTTHGGHQRFVVIDPGQFGRVPSITLTGSQTSSATNISVTAARQHYIA